MRVAIAFFGSIAIFEWVYSKTLVSNLFLNRLAQAGIILILISAIGAALVGFREFVSALKPRFDRDFLGSLRYSLPTLLSLMPAAFFSTGGSVWIADWKLILVENFFHSAVIEELLYRGIIFKLMSRRYSLKKSALYSAFIFGVAHLNPVFTSPDLAHAGFNLLRALLTVASGYCLALLFSKYRWNLWVPIAFHFALNGLGFLTAQEDARGIAISLLGMAVSFVWVTATLSNAPRESVLL